MPPVHRCVVFAALLFLSVNAVVVLSPHWYPHDPGLAIAWDPSSEPSESVLDTNTILIDLDMVIPAHQCGPPDPWRVLCINKLSNGDNSFVEAWKLMLEKSCQVLKLIGKRKHCHFDQISLDRGFQEPWMSAAFRMVFHARNWTTHDHHDAHATMAFYSSPFVSATILVLDGGGSEGVNTQFKVYSADKVNGIRLIDPSPMNPVMWYSLHAIALFFRFKRLKIPWWIASPADNFMSLSAKGTPRPTCGAAMMDRIRRVWAPTRKEVKEVGELCIPIGRKDYAATAQRAYEEIVVEMLQKHKMLIENTDGIVIAGGGAFNILMNTVVMEKFQKRVFVPPGPGDMGTPIGAVWMMQPELARQSLFLGMPVFDAKAVLKLVATAGGVRISPAEVASYLARSHVVAIVRGRQAIGHHPLGRRSLLSTISLPNYLRLFDAHERRRHWAPTLICEDEDASLFFRATNSSLLWSPAANLAPKFQTGLASDHFDTYPQKSIFRLQTVSKSDDSWLYAVLEELIRICKSQGLILPGLLSTSIPDRFTRSANATLSLLRTKPVVLNAVQSRPFADFLILDNFLFRGG